MYIEQSVIYDKIEAKRQRQGKKKRHSKELKQEIGQNKIIGM